MAYKYPKFQQDYKDEHWRQLANKQARDLKIYIALGLIAAGVAGGFYFLNWDDYLFGWFMYFRGWPS